MQSLDSVQNKIFMAVGPSRIAVLGLILLMETRDHDVAEDVHTRRWEQCRKRLVEAQTMLDNDVENILASCEFHLSPDLIQAREAAAEALRPFYTLITRTDFTLHRYADEIAALKIQGLFTVEAAVTRFLNLLTESLTVENNARNETKSLEMRHMVTQVDDLGRNIQLIAFNASVEAARIGDQGKGFSVIAAEIRELSGKMEHTLEALSARLSTQNLS